MDTERFRRLESLFAEAVDLAPENVDAFIAERCNEDSELEIKLRAMLAADTNATARVMSLVDVPDPTAIQIEEHIGREIGPYRIEGLLGAGAMGVVYRAMRADGAYEQEVALKIVASRMADPDVRSRFLRERQVLASLEHPGIARLLDGGVTKDGTPYLVMECVAGESLIDYCDKHRLGIADRLRVFEKVCDAVRHAHANLIVHRDLKPAHIIIGKDGRPKLLDFGIAAVLDRAEPSDATQTQLRRFTPQYASPEQLTGGNITTATDVYALGVVLYQLLAGRLPYDVQTGASDAERQLICETVPAPPSRLTAASTDSSEADAASIAAARRIPLARLRRELRGDLDTIVMTALQKDQARRYGSAEALLQDLERYRQGLPLAARPDTAGYRMRKFVLRHKLPAIAAAVTVVALVAATLVSINFGVQATRQAAIANATVSFLQEDVLARADPFEEVDRELTLRAALDRAAQSIGDRFTEQPLVHAALRTTLGDAYTGLGEFEVSRDHHLVARDLRSEALGRSHPDTLAAALAASGAMVDAGDIEGGAELTAEILPVATASLGESHPLTLSIMKLDALILDALGDYEVAAEKMRVAVDRHQAVLGSDDPETLAAQNDYALMLAEAGRFDEAEPVMRQVLERRREVLGPAHPYTLLSYGSLGFLLNQAGRYEAGLGELQGALAVAREVLGDQHPRTAMYLHLLAGSYRGLERTDEALAVAEESFNIRREALGAAHPEAMQSMVTYALLLQDAERLDESESLLRERYDLGIAGEGADHPATLIAANNLASVLIDKLKPAEGEAIAADTVERAMNVLPEGHWLTGAFQTTHGRSLLALERLRDADAVLADARQLMVDALGAGHERVARIDEILAQSSSQAASIE